MLSINFLMVLITHLKLLIVKKTIFDITGVHLHILKALAIKFTTLLLVKSIFSAEEYFTSVDFTIVVVC